MRHIYKNSFSENLVSVLLFGGLSMAGVFMLTVPTDLTPFERLCAILVIPLGPFMVYLTSTLAYVVDDETITIRPPPYVDRLPLIKHTVAWRGSQTLRWEEVDVVLIEHNSMLHAVLVPGRSRGKAPLAIMLPRPRLRMLVEIISHLRPTVPLYLDLWAKRWLERKPAWVAWLTWKDEFYGMTRDELWALPRLQSVRSSLGAGDRPDDVDQGL
jgi:hypothetical protein